MKDITEVMDNLNDSHTSGDSVRVDGGSGSSAAARGLVASATTSAPLGTRIRAVALVSIVLHTHPDQLRGPAQVVPSVTWSHGAAG